MRKFASFILACLSTVRHILVYKRINVVRHGPLILPNMLPGRDGANINGPSLVKVPAWVRNPLGQYYLYFAHHRGSYIRLAYANNITGPWTVFAPGTLKLSQCIGFVTGHIASPDVLIDASNQRFVMYFHGPAVAAGTQKTFGATSPDGINFTPLSPILGNAYSRAFKGDDGYIYALFGRDNQYVARSWDGLTNWTRGPVVLPGTARHVAVQKKGSTLRVFYSVVGDAPEHIRVGTIDLTQPWTSWLVKNDHALLKPATLYEGVTYSIAASVSGIATNVHQLRDPAIYEEGGRTWLVYSVAGESGLGLAELNV